MIKLMVNKPIPGYQFPSFQPIHFEHFSLQMIGLHSTRLLFGLWLNQNCTILRGMPAYSEKLQKDIKKKKVILGGCSVSGNDPDYKLSLIHISEPTRLGM